MRWWCLFTIFTSVNAFLNISQRWWKYKRGCSWVIMPSETQGAKPMSISYKRYDITQNWFFTSGEIRSPKSRKSFQQSTMSVLLFALMNDLWDSLTSSLPGNHSLNQEVCMGLGNCITCQVIVLDSCSNPQRLGKYSNVQWKKHLGFWVFCEWRHKWSSFRHFWSTSSGPGPKLLDSSILLKFLLETRLKSESFETLGDLLGFQVEKLWPKKNKIINTIIRKFIILLFSGHNNRTINTRKATKGSKDSDSCLVSNENLNKILLSTSVDFNVFSHSSLTKPKLRQFLLNKDHK